MVIKFIKEILINKADLMVMVKCIILTGRFLLESLSKELPKGLDILYGKMDLFIKGI